MDLDPTIKSSSEYLTIGSQGYCVRSIVERDSANVLHIEIGKIVDIDLVVSREYR